MNEEKYVDESWKEQASQEKGILADLPQKEGGSDKIITNEPVDDVPQQAPESSQESEGAGEPLQSVEVNFLNYVTSLGFQTMIFLGEIPNPVTNEPEKNLTQAKFLIDTLEMLKEKTEGNLSDQERDFLKNSVYELQMKFVQVSGQESSSNEDQSA